MARLLLLVPALTVLAACSSAGPIQVPAASEDGGLTTGSPQDLADGPGAGQDAEGGGGVFAGVGDYLDDRLLDLLDVASLRLVFGPGLRFNVRVTEVLQIGAGSTGTVAPPDSFTMEAHTIGTIRREGGVWTSRVSEAGISLFYSYDSEGNLIKGNKSYFGEAERGFYDIGFAVHAGLIGAEAEVRPDELIDLGLGFFGFDIMGDDADTD